MSFLKLFHKVSVLNVVQLWTTAIIQPSCPPSSDFNGAEEGTQRRAKRLNRVKVGRRLTGGWAELAVHIKIRDCQ